MIDERMRRQTEWQIQQTKQMTRYTTQPAKSATLFFFAGSMAQTLPYQERYRHKDNYVQKGENQINQV
jgi:hypothetical protein